MTNNIAKCGCDISLTFGESLKGSKTLKEFKDYILRLERKYGKKAYRVYNMADLSIMME